MTEQHAEISALRAEATAMAGGIGDLAQRASVYHHLYEHSGGNHCFPLLAAHGALWASGYFRSGLRFGGIVAAIRGLTGANQVALMADLQRFADAFRDINRRVCVETFFIYQLTARPSLRSHTKRIVPTPLLAAMDRCHAARSTGYAMSKTERRELFEAFFLWEQATIVGPSILAAYDDFNWQLIKWLALRPAIRFAYFAGAPLRFRDFANTDERITMGLRAFDRADARGWVQVEQTLNRYGVMPSAFATDPSAFFHGLTAPMRIAPAAI